MVSVYPNPNRGSFTLQTTNCFGDFYTISDMMGHINEHHQIISGTQQIDLGSAAEGGYTLKIREAQPWRFIVVR